MSYGRMGKRSREAIEEMRAGLEGFVSTRRFFSASLFNAALFLGGSLFETPHRREPPPSRPGTSPTLRQAPVLRRFNTSCCASHCSARRSLSSADSPHPKRARAGRATRERATRERAAGKVNVRGVRESMVLDGEGRACISVKGYGKVGRADPTPPPHLTEQGVAPPLSLASRSSIHATMSASALSSRPALFGDRLVRPGLIEERVVLEDRRAACVCRTCSLSRRVSPSRPPVSHHPLSPPRHS